jgi:hypothetical protein
MKDSTLIQEEDSAGEDSMERLLKEYMGLFKDIDSEGHEEYAAYFTDGDDMLVYETHDSDKDNAEWALNKVVCLYWLKKSKKMQGDEGTDCNDGLYAFIRSAIAKNYRRKDFGERL